MIFEKNNQKELTKKIQTFIQKPGIGLLIMLGLLMVCFSFLSPYFFTLRNFFDVLMSVVLIGIASIGMTMILVSGGLDLSIASNMAATGVVVALLVKGGTPLIPSLLAGLGFSALVGLINGVIVTRLKINPIITTLGTMSIIRGFAYLLSGGLSINIRSSTYGLLGRGYVGPVPISVILMGALYIIAYFVLNHMEFGRYVYAVGGNEVASRLSGINVGNIRVYLYTICGFTAGISGIILTSSMGTGMANVASGYELTVITAVILGGTSLSGGKGTIQGTLLGVLVMGTLNNGMTLLGLPSFYQMVARGAVLLLAMFIDRLRSGTYS